MRTDYNATSTIKENFEPALDNEGLRKLNSKKVINMVEEITENMREAKKSAKATKYYLYAILIVMGFIFLGSILVVAIKSGGVSNFIDNFWVVDNVNKRIICSYDHQNWSARSAVEANSFKKVFPDSICEVLNKDEKS